MDGGIVLPIVVQDKASDKFDKMAKKGQQAAKTLKDAFSKGFNLKKDELLKGNLLNQAAWAIGSGIAKNIGNGIKAGIDISNEMTSMMGKLRMALDPGTSVNDSLAKIEQQANKSRVPMETLTKAVANLGLTTGKYFTNDELITFTGTLSSYAALVGADTAQIESAQYQLTQAFSKGKMAMDDFKPIMNAMPGIATELAKALGVSTSELQEMVSAGKVTTDVMKKAFLGMADSVQEKLDKMPKTFDQRMNGIRNATFAAKKAIGGLFQDIAESKMMQVVLGGIELAIKKLVTLFNALRKVFKKVFGTGKDEAEDLSKAIETFANVALVIILGLIGVVAILAVKFVILGVQALWAGIQTMMAGFAAQLGWWPVILIFIAIILIIAVVVGVLSYLGIGFADVAEVIGAVLGGAIAFVWNLFLGLLDLVLGIINYFGRYFTAFANFFANVFKDPISSIIYLFRDMAKAVLGILKSIASALDKLFGSNLAGTVQGWMNGVDSLADKAANKWGNGNYDAEEWKEISSESLGLARANYGEWTSKGAQMGRSFGEGVEDALSGVTGLFGEDMLGIGEDNQLSDYDASTGKGSLSTSLDEDSIDDLKAFAEIQYRLNYKHITPNVNIKFGDIRETADINDITAYIKKMMNEDLEELYITEGGQ